MHKLITRFAMLASVLATTVAFAAAPANAGPRCADSIPSSNGLCYEN